MYPVALRDEIRTWVLIQGKSQRAAACHFGLSRNTVAKLLQEGPAPKERRYQRQVAHKTPVRDLALPHIEGWLKENEWLSRWAPKQCWTAHRMWVELHTLGIPIGESTVRMYVQERHTPSKPAYIPLDFAPGERAEFDFGEATVKLGGQLVKVPFLAGRLRFSGAMYVECFPTQRQEAFLLGQRHAFEFWGGVPRTAVYDNLKPAVIQVLQGHSRRENDVFLHFHSVYCFEAIFANVRAGWEKGSVENLVGYARRNYLVPLPEGKDLELINGDLRYNCLTDQQRIMAGRTDPIASRLEVERAYLGPLPAHPPVLGPLVEVLVHSTGRVRFQTNDYSVPIQYAHQRLTLEATPFRVCLFADSELVADHPRSYAKRQVIEDWRHYLPLLLKKSFAVPWASALRHGELPPSFEAARLDLVARRPDGNREFVRLLELCLTHEVTAVEAALLQVVIKVKLQRFLRRMFGNRRECSTAMPVQEHHMSLRFLRLYCSVKRKPETLFLLLLRFTGFNQGDPLLERVPQTADGRFPCFALISQVSPQKTLKFDPIYYQARAQGGWSADAVRQLLHFTSAQNVVALPLDPSQYPAYQMAATPPDLAAYNRLLEVQP